MTYTTHVSVRHWASLIDTPNTLHAALNDIGGIEAFVSPGQTVVIKPNVTADAPACSGGTTRVELVEALVREVQTCGARRVLVAESTGRFGTSHDTAFPRGGWREMAARTGAELYNLDAGEHVDREAEGGHYPGPLPFSQLVLECDVFISVPCLKTHINADYTVSLKNSYALIPQWKRSEVHRQYLLEECLADINIIRAPDLTVVDGYDGSEGVAAGTDFERPAGARTLIIGADPVAVDTVSREVMALTAPTRYLTWCVEAGVGQGDMKAIQTVGDGLDACRHPFMSPPQEVELKMPGVRICDMGACSGCRSAASTAVHRYAQQKLLAPLTVVLGKGASQPLASRPSDTVLLVGNCAVGYVNYYSKDVIAITGCPARQDHILAAIEEAGLICVQCRELAQALVDHLPDELAPVLRVVAAGQEVYAGDHVERGRHHLELLVGDCQARYAAAVLERATQFGMDPERDIVWLQGCPPSWEALVAAADRLGSVVGALG